jgi:signal transduction histidine kinase
LIEVDNVSSGRRIKSAIESFIAQLKGAGLSLAFQIDTDLHGGTATVRSEVGRGTTVILTFPSRGSSKSGT